MKKLTAKQRGEIYLKVAEILTENRYHICGQLAKYIDQHGWSAEGMSTNKVCENFDEFSLFQPDNININDCWFDIGDMEQRITCMLLCYEMTKK